MSERTDEYPRIHSCLRNWCPSRWEECDRCDAVLAILKAHRNTGKGLDGAGAIQPSAGKP